MIAALSCPRVVKGGAAAISGYYDSVRAGRVSRPPIFQSTRPLVFAHRGGARLAPENTIPAFDNGMAHGADGLELDVQLSADGVAVV
ncbi:MAG: glycerophosphodiester phosphodiesterase family protein, partial [Vicinamibacterales bacterium]